MRNPVRYGHEYRNSKHPQPIKADHDYGQASLRCRDVRDCVVDLFAGSGGFLVALLRYASLRTKREALWQATVTR